MKEEIENNIPDLPGLIFKDQTFKENSADLIGKYIISFTKNGRKIIKLLAYDPKTFKIDYEVYAGNDEQVGKRFRGLIEPELQFYAFHEDALSFAMIHNDAG